MAAGDYFPPAYQETAFHCPNCGVYARQMWNQAYYEVTYGDSAIFGATKIDGLSVATCSHCNAYSLWVGEQMVYPSTGTAPLPHPKMPHAVKRDYEEARTIATASPRGAAALLRLAIQRLCQHLGQPGKNINDDIAALVQQGLPRSVQEALDVVRVVGNNAVHPGEIKLDDDPKVAGTLFRLVNIITEKMVAEPEEIRELYEGLPEGQKQQIAKRDKKA